MAIKVNTYNQNGEVSGEIELSEKIFGQKVNQDLVHQAVVAQLANQRPVLAHTKTKAEVSGGGKKPWKQKGTGRARVGSNRSPLWIGGGITFGPRKDRNFKKDLNRKMKQKAIFMALSDKLASGSLVVLDKLELAEYKTKAVSGILKNLEEKAMPKKAADSQAKKIKRSCLILNLADNQKVKYSARNLAGIEVLNLENINIVDLLKYRDLVAGREVIEKIEAQYSNK